MGKFEIHIPHIDFLYWSNKNDYFSDNQITSTVKQGLKHAERGGLLEQVLATEGIQSNKMLVDLIERKIQSHNYINDFSDMELLIIFDLIQGWGGKMGKTPYVKPPNGPTRVTWQPLAETYREAISICFELNLDYKKLLNSLKKIPGIKDSFATKHMFFWTEYGPRRRSVPIYDKRIKLLLCLDDRNAADYETFVLKLNEAAQKLDVSLGLIERALFAFSQNYFPNGSLIIDLKKLVDSTDIEEARSLEKRFIALANNSPT